MCEGEYMYQLDTIPRQCVNKCPDNYFIVKDNNLCVEVCEEGFYL